VSGADSDDVARVYRFEVARGFRDDVAHLSDLISPRGRGVLAGWLSGIGQAAWSILKRGLNLFFCCCCGCCGHVVNALALSKRSGMSTTGGYRWCFRAHRCAPIVGGKFFQLKTMA
jgi:hypothetical protein